MNTWVNKILVMAIAAACSASAVGSGVWQTAGGGGGDPVNATTVTGALNGASITIVETLESTDKLLLQQSTDSDNLKVISADKVTDADKITNVPADTLLGRATPEGALGTVELLPMESVRQMLNVENGATANPNAIETTSVNRFNTLPEVTTAPDNGFLLFQNTDGSLGRIKFANLPSAPAPDTEPAGIKYTTSFGVVDDFVQSAMARVNTGGAGFVDFIFIGDRNNNAGTHGWDEGWSQGIVDNGGTIYGSYFAGPNENSGSGIGLGYDANIATLGVNGSHTGAPAFIEDEFKIMYSGRYAYFVDANPLEEFALFMQAGNVFFPASQTIKWRAHIAKFASSPATGTWRIRQEVSPFANVVAPAALDFSGGDSLADITITTTPAMGLTNDNHALRFDDIDGGNAGIISLDFYRTNVSNGGAVDANMYWVTYGGVEHVSILGGATDYQVGYYADRAIKRQLDINPNVSPRVIYVINLGVNDRLDADDSAATFATNTTTIMNKLEAAHTARGYSLDTVGFLLMPSQRQTDAADDAELASYRAEMQTLAQNRARTGSIDLNAIMTATGGSPGQTGWYSGTTELTTAGYDEVGRLAINSYLAATSASSTAIAVSTPVVDPEVPPDMPSVFDNYVLYDTTTMQTASGQLGHGLGASSPTADDGILPRLQTIYPNNVWSPWNGTQIVQPTATPFRTRTQLVALDIEHLKPTQGLNSMIANGRGVHDETQLLIDALNWMKIENPDRLFCQYQHPGTAAIDITQSANRTRDSALWTRRNQRLHDELDFFCPQMYPDSNTVLADWTAWQDAAETHIFSHYPNKPVIPYVHWWRELTQPPASQYVGETFWRGMLDYSFTNYEGLMIWAPGNVTYNANDAYVQVIEAFKTANGL